MIFALIAVGLAAWEFPAVNPHQATATYAVAAVLATVVFFASLLAHEVAHSLVARHYGLTVKSITLWLFGGVSELSGDVPDPGAEARIAGAGPEKTKENRSRRTATNTSRTPQHTRTSRRRWRPWTPSSSCARTA